jgi:hypothetical protein
MTKVETYIGVSEQCIHTGLSTRCDLGPSIHIGIEFPETINGHTMRVWRLLWRDDGVVWRKWHHTCSTKTVLTSGLLFIRLRSSHIVSKVHIWLICRVRKSSVRVYVRCRESFSNPRHIQKVSNYEKPYLCRLGRASNLWLHSVHVGTLDIAIMQTQTNIIKSLYSPTTPECMLSEELCRTGHFIPPVSCLCHLKSL